MAEESVSTKTVLAFQISNDERETHEYEFQIPPRSEIKKYLIGRNIEYSAIQVKLSSGRFEKVDHALYFYLCKKDCTIGVDFKFAKPCRHHIIKAAYELQFLSNGLSKAEIKGKLVREIDDFTFEKWAGPWETLSKSDWTDSIDTIRLVFNIKLGEEWVTISPSEAGVAAGLSSSAVNNVSSASNEVDLSTLSPAVDVSGIQNHIEVTDFFMSPLFSDLQLVCGNQNFPAHRLILSCKSSVFKSMFEESLEGRIVIDDIQPEILKKMLRYIYTGSSDVSPVIALDLFKAADKYKLEDLKSKCIISVEKGLEFYAAQQGGITTPKKRFRTQ